MRKITELPEWQALLAHAKEIMPSTLKQAFQQDPSRSSRYVINHQGILLDYSRNRINDTTLYLMFKLANARQLKEKIAALFAGQPINFTEKRPALHTALRSPNKAPFMLNGDDISARVKAGLDKMLALANGIRSGECRGVTGKKICHVVNLGIGGSHLGPLMTQEALASYATTDLSCHFISSVDKTELISTLKKVDPETTLFIIASKSFQTTETLTNANSALAWMKTQLPEKSIEQHFVAVTAKEDQALKWGIPSRHILPIWDWVGGRYSIWSAIGFPLALQIGNEQFREFLQGAHAIDEHFQTAPFEANLPVILGLLNIWYLNFFEAKATAILPYSHALRFLPLYLQQAEMESNGKSVDRLGERLSHGTSPILFGEEGCHAQHAFMQLLHQGQHFIPVDFILIKSLSAKKDLHHHTLIASALSQAEALMRGKASQEIALQMQAQGYSSEEAHYLAQHKMIPGNKPSNIIFLDQLTPFHLGALLALYEHKIFVQGAIWEINSFDQWGVELGKELLPAILKRIEGAELSKQDSLSYLIAHYLNKGEIS